MSSEINEPTAIELLTTWCKDSLAKFRADHADLRLRWFVLYSRPEQGFAWTCFCSSRKSEEHARHWERKNSTYRDELLQNPTWADHAYYQIGSHQVSTHCDNPANFDFEAYSEVSVPEWGSDETHEHHPIPAEGETSPLENRVALELWSTLHALKEQGAFDGLCQGPYFSLGLCIGDGPLIPLWVLQWPEHTEQ